MLIVLMVKVDWRCGPGSSVGIAIGYGVDGPGIECRWGRDFPHLSRPALGAHPASCTMGTGPFPGVKSGRGVTLTTHYHLAPRYIYIYIYTNVNIYIYIYIHTHTHTWWRSWLRHCATSRKVAGSIPDGVRPNYGTEFDSASNRNEYQEYFLGVKAGGA